MVYLREIRLTGGDQDDAYINFGSGANVVSGASDTGKSFLIDCIDFVFGADEWRRLIDEAKPYLQVLIELENEDGDRLTLKRAVSGGDILVYPAPIRTHSEAQHRVAIPKRSGRQVAYDISQAFFEFCGIGTEIRLRKNAGGKTQRLSVRTLLPAFIVGETSIIAEKSPLYGDSGFSNTVSQRMLSYLLTGTDDEDIEPQDDAGIDRNQIEAQLELAKRLHAESAEKVDRQKDLAPGLEKSIDNVEQSIQELTSRIDLSKAERRSLQSERLDLISSINKRQTQASALSELLVRYDLLNERYESDLKRLDFISEGTYYLSALQHAICPYCGQEIKDEPHEHGSSKAEIPEEAYEAAIKEAAKIKGLQTDLSAAIEDLTGRIEELESTLDTERTRLSSIDDQIDRVFIPEQSQSRDQMRLLVDRRLTYNSLQDDIDRRDELADLCETLQKTLDDAPKGSQRHWKAIDEVALDGFCNTISTLLKSWSWPGDSHVTFDAKKYDIFVDGKSRQSHGKGVRSVLHAAFTIGLLQYCHENDLPHPGFVVIDSPLTTYKQGEKRSQGDEVDATVEASFWRSLRQIPSEVQIIVLENKEPPTDVSEGLNYHLFAGAEGEPGERYGFF